MEYSLYNLEIWYSQLLSLVEKLNRSVELYEDYQQVLSKINNKENFLDTGEKITIFLEKLSSIEDNVSSILNTLKDTRKKLNEHCMFIPEGPSFKINHDTGTFKIVRNVAFIEIHIYMGKGQYLFHQKVRYLFEDKNFFQKSF